MKKLFLIDANSLIHRTFHALPPLNSKDNKPTNALYGLASILISMLRDKPDFCAALFDRPEPTFRKEKFQEYKAQRPKAPDELIFQIIEAHNLFQAFNIKFFEEPGFEADDLIASLALKFINVPDLQIIILTGDRDTFQIIKDKKIIVRILKKGISEVEDYDEDLILSKFQILPEELIDFKALVGDPSDNIPGVSGIGPKTAIDLIQKYKTIENLFKHLNEIQNLKEKLLKEKENVLLYKKLVTLNKNLKINVNLNDLKFEPNNEKIIAYFEKFGFKTLIKRILNNQKNNESKNNNFKTQTQRQATIF
jgi:DNA polymerase-1